MNQELAVVDPQAVEISPRNVSVAMLDVIARAAADSNVDIAKMTALLDLQERIVSRQAEQLFHEAMARFQEECPIIVKSKEGGRTKAGTLVYKFAPLDKIVAAVKGLLTKHGFSYKIETEFPDNRVRAICIVTHIGGHSESTSVELPLITKTDIMSAPQVVSGTITFAKRVAFTNAFGIMTGDEDNDGNTIGAITEKQVETIEDMLHACGMSNEPQRAKFLEVIGFPSVPEIHRAAYPAALNFLQMKQRKGS